MPDYHLRHLNFGGFVARERYVSRNSAPRERAVHDRVAHAQKLRAEYSRAFEGAEAIKSKLDLPAEVKRPEGTYVVVTQSAGGDGKVDLPSKGIRQGTQRAREDGGRDIIVHVPQGKRDVLEAIIAEYGGGPLSAKGNPPNQARVEAIDAFRAFTLACMWREDQARLPGPDSDPTWWGVWCWPDCATDVRALAERFRLTVGAPDRDMVFPEAVIVPIHGSRVGIELLIWASDGGVAELGTWVDDAAVLDTLDHNEQNDLVMDLAERVVWPGDDVPVVCLLDTGVNRAHPLIEPALSPDDLHTVEPGWSVDDDNGHGSGMSGILLHGDLASRLGDHSMPVLRHRMESVKLMPPPGAAGHEARNYGAVTQGAVFTAEIARPDRIRVVCSAVTARDVAGDHPTRWSAALDQLASGWTPDPSEDPEPRRLIVQAMGNVPDGRTADEEDPANHPGEDPAQAWNVLTVGGVTFRTEISDAGYESWTPRVDAGEASPHARTSEAWPRRSPVKPDVVFEAGNRADDPAGMPPQGRLPSLSLVTTGRGGTAPWVQPFNATSAATAEAARMAARIMAEHPHYWPETVRALLVHSARWTPAMRARLDALGGSTARSSLRRVFGYGMPDLERALGSARNDLAMVAQAEIQPFAKRTGFEEAHYYPLPWPVRELQDLGDRWVRLKVVLSYFVEPNPSSAAKLDPVAYQSHGLRFDLQRRTEGYDEFRRATNKALSKTAVKRETDEGWLFGENSVSAGSLHVDVWEGPAAVLAARRSIAVKPVGGWWGERVRTGRRERKRDTRSCWDWRRRGSTSISTHQSRLPSGCGRQLTFNTVGRLEKWSRPWRCGMSVGMMRH